MYEERIFLHVRENLSHEKINVLILSHFLNYASILTNSINGQMTFFDKICHFIPFLIDSEYDFSARVNDKNNMSGRS